MKDLPEKDKITKEETEEVEKQEIPQWALELKASIEKLADALARPVEKQEEEEEEEPEEEEKKKQEEEEEKEPEEEEKQLQDEEKYPLEEEEEKKKSLDSMISDAVGKATKGLDKRIEKIIAKSLEGLPEKRTLVPKDVKPKALSVGELKAMGWRKVHEMAKNMGA